MNFGTGIVLLILCGAVALIIRGMIRDKKNGKSLHCGMDCRNCSGFCTQYQTECRISKDKDK